MAPDHPERVAAWLGEVFGARARTASALGAMTAWSPSTSGRPFAKSSVPAGSICSAGPQTTLGFRPIPNGVPRSSRTSSGARGSPWRTRSRTPSHLRTCRCRGGGGSVTRRPPQGCRLSPRGQRNRTPSSPEPTSRSASRSTSSRSFATSIVDRCASRSTSGHTRRCPGTPERSSIACGGDDAVRRSLAGGQGRRLRALDRLGKGCLKRITRNPVA